MSPGDIVWHGTQAGKVVRVGPRVVRVRLPDPNGRTWTQEASWPTGKVVPDSEEHRAVVHRQRRVESVRRRLYLLAPAVASWPDEDLATVERLLAMVAP